MLVRRITPSMHGLAEALRAIDNNAKQQGTAPVGSIVINEDQTLSTMDPNTGVSAVFGLQDDGSVGFKQFLGDTVAPPVPTAPVASSASGIALIAWDGLFGDGSPAPADFSHCNVYGQKDGDTVVVLAGSVINPGDTVSYAGATPGDTWTFWLTALDTNGNESASSLTTGIKIASVLDDTGLAQALADNNTAIANANTAIALKSSILSASAAPSGSHNLNDVWFNTSEGNKPYRWDGSAWVSTQDQAVVDAQSAAVSANNVAASANNTAIAAQNTAVSAQNTAVSAQNTANSVNSIAVSAQNTAVSAQNMAVSAQNTAVSANNLAVSAQNTAVSANNVAVSAQNTATTAQSTAVSAQNTAVSANNAAASAQITANSAMATAVSANNVAVSANNTAASAQSTAASAQSAAVSAQNVAASANALANTANNTANSAQVIANGKNNIFLTSTTPTASADGDMWVDLGNGRTLKSWSASSTAWVPTIQSGAITATQIAADTIVAGNIAAGAITASELAANSVSASALLANSITATALAAGSVTASALAAQSITATALAAQSITATALAAQSITATALAAQSVTASALKAQSITATALAAGSITASALAAQSITATALAAQSITATALAAQSITATAMAAASISATALQAGSVAASTIAAQSITATALAAQSITATALAAQSITATALAAQSITATALAAQSITASAMAAGSISATALQAGSVAASTLAAQSITATALAAQSITASALAAQSITATALAAQSITATALAAQSITATALAAQAITATAMAANSISATALQAGSIAASTLAAKSITASALATGSVTADAISAGSITASALGAGSVTASAIKAGSITASSGIIADISADTIQSGTLSANFVTIGSGTNALSDPGFNSPVIVAARTALSTGASGGWSVTAGTSTGLKKATRTTTSTSDTFTYLVDPHTYANAGQLIPCAAGQIWTLKVDTTTSSSAAVVAFQAYTARADGTVATSAIASTSIASTGQRSVSATYTIPAGVTGFMIGLTCNTSGVTWSVHGNAFVGQQITGDLIVNGAINGQTITGATIQSAASGARIVLDQTSLNAWNDSGANYFNMSSASGVNIAALGDVGFDLIRTNYCTNPSVEVDISGWTSAQTIIRDTTKSFVDNASIKSTHTATVNRTITRIQPVPPINGDYVFSFYAMHNAAVTRQIHGEIYFTNSSGTTVASGSFVGGDTPVSPNAWTNVAVFTNLGSIPAGAVNIKLVVSGTGFLSTETLWIDAVMLDAAYLTVNSYFDGSEAPYSNYTFVWQGTTGLSYSDMRQTRNVTIKTGLNDVLTPRQGQSPGVGFTLPTPFQQTAGLFSDGTTVSLIEGASDPQLTRFDVGAQQIRAWSQSAMSLVSKGNVELQSQVGSVSLDAPNIYLNGAPTVAASHWTSTSTQTGVPSGQYWGPGTPAYDSTNTSNPYLVSWSAADTIKFLNDGIYAISVAVRFTAAMVAGGTPVPFVSIEPPAGGTGVNSLAYAKGPIGIGDSQGTAAIPNIKVISNATMKFVTFQNTGASQTAYWRINVTRIG